MPDPQSPRDLLGQVMVEGRRVLVPYVAEMLKRKGIKQVDSTEERERFWRSAITDEQEALIWQQEAIARGITEYLPGDANTIDVGLKVSKMKYPNRWDMMPGEGREHTSQQAEWAWKHLQRGAPEPKVEQPGPVEGEG